MFPVKDTFYCHDWFYFCLVLSQSQTLDKCAPQGLGSVSCSVIRLTKKKKSSHDFVLSINEASKTNTRHSIQFSSSYKQTKLPIKLTPLLEALLLLLLLQDCLLSWHLRGDVDTRGVDSLPHSRLHRVHHHRALSVWAWGRWDRHRLLLLATQST